MCFAERERTKIEGLDLNLGDDKQEVLLVASVPLTNENWIPLAEGEIQAIANGSVLDVVKAN